MNRAVLEGCRPKRCDCGLFPKIRAIAPRRGLAKLTRGLLCGGFVTAAVHGNFPAIACQPQGYCLSNSAGRSSHEHAPRFHHASLLVHLDPNPSFEASLYVMLNPAELERGALVSELKRAKA